MDVYVGVIDFEICRFNESTKVSVSRERNIFYQIKYLIHHTSNTSLRQKKHLVIEVTFKLPWNLGKLY